MVNTTPFEGSSSLSLSMVCLVGCFSNSLHHCLCVCVCVCVCACVCACVLVCVRASFSLGWIVSCHAPVASPALSMLARVESPQTFLDLNDLNVLINARSGKRCCAACFLKWDELLRCELLFPHFTKPSKLKWLQKGKPVLFREESQRKVCLFSSSKSSAFCMSCFF